MPFTRACGCSLNLFFGVVRKICNLSRHDTRQSQSSINSRRQWRSPRPAITLTSEGPALGKKLDDQILFSKKLSLPLGILCRAVHRAAANLNFLSHRIGPMRPVNFAGWSTLPKFCELGPTVVDAVSGSTSPGRDERSTTLRSLPRRQQYCITPCHGPSFCRRWPFRSRFTRHPTCERNKIVAALRVSGCGPSGAVSLRRSIG